MNRPAEMAVQWRFSAELLSDISETLQQSGRDFINFAMYFADFVHFMPQLCKIRAF